MRVIKHRQIVTDDWQRLTELEPEDALPPGKVIVPFSWWQDNRGKLIAAGGKYAVCINGGHEVEEVARDARLRR